MILNEVVAQARRVLSATKRIGRPVAIGSLLQVANDNDQHWESDPEKRFINLQALALLVEGGGLMPDQALQGTDDCQHIFTARWAAQL